MKGMNDDQQILRRYAENGAEDAFRELVDRHLPLVYSTALRMVGGDVHLAEDVSQRVFADVARKARTLSRHASLAGWLHWHATYTASKAVRTERRRTAREQEAAHMNVPGDGEGGADWTMVEPHLDQALDALGRSDREAVVLRFLQQRDLRSVGQALGCSEDAAQKRVTRALDKLRRFLERRGVALSAAGLSALLGGHASAAVPAGLAASVSTGAVAAAGAGVGVVGTSIISTLTGLMTTEKLTTATVSTLLIAGLGTPLALQHRTNRNLEAENVVLRQQVELNQQGPAADGSVAGLAVDPDELDRLRRENVELHRLRGEVALLRNQKQEVERMAAETAEARRELNQMARQMAEAQSAQRTPEQQQEYQTGIDRLNFSKQWMLAIYLYADAQGGVVPTQLAEAVPYFEAGDEPIQGLSTDDLEIVYAGRFDEISEPARTIVLREREPRPAPDGKWTRAYGFADGHSEIRSQTTPDFSVWEEERMVTGAH
jgi:RNA polymerase sigma factor (sigma-70 family)